MKQRTLEARAKEVIMLKMEQMGEMDTEDVMELLRPHFMFDSIVAKEQAIRRKANSLMAQFKDEKGIRRCFAHGDKYVDIETTNDLNALNGIIEKHSKVHDKYDADIKKAKFRKLELLGQQSFDFTTAEKERSHGG